MNKIKLLLSIALILKVGLCAQELTVSVFWVCPTLYPKAQFMFGKENPNDMANTIGKATASNVMKTCGNQSYFTQYVEGPYFAMGPNASFYMSGQANNGATGSNMQTLRLIFHGATTNNPTIAGINSNVKAAGTGLYDFWQKEFSTSWQCKKSTDSFSVGGEA